MEEQEKEEKKFEGVKCPRCNSGFVYFKKKDQEWQCRKCGNLFKNENLIKDGEH